MPTQAGYRNISVPEELVKDFEKVVQLGSLGIRNPTEGLVMAGRMWIAWHNSTYLRERRALDEAVRAKMQEAARDGQPFDDPMGLGKKRGK